MTDQDYIYGVFDNADGVPDIVSRLHKAGLKTSEICILGEKSEQFDIVAAQITDPTSKHFILFGIGGAIAGLVAGCCMSLHIPGVNGFQLIVPLMGTVAGGACFPYIICQLGTFLMSNKPQHWANVFEGKVNAGSVIVMAEPQSKRALQSAMDIFLSNGATDMVFRKSPWGVVDTSVETDNAVPTKENRKLTAVA